MSEIQDLMKDIEKLRMNLEELIDNIQDPDLIVASQILNGAISEYNKFIQKNIK